MLSHQLGFSSSWKMLTRDKGWIKPLLVLTLVGWIPIVGQIVILGYGLEWARLTAWGVDSAPKQAGIRYGKLFRTGGIAFLVMLTMGLVLGALDALLFQGAIFGSTFITSDTLLEQSTRYYAGISLGSVTGGLLALVISLFLETFILVAMMRSTIYDSFSAGWRLDRIFQMIGRDFGGFFRVYLVSLIGGLINWVYSQVISLLAGIVVLGAVFKFSYMLPLVTNSTEEVVSVLSKMLMEIGAGPLLLFVLLGIALAFVGGVIETAMHLVGMNAAGQWFCRFDLPRWGVSADSLPNGVPVTFADDGSAPTMPSEPAPPHAPSDAQGDVSRETTEPVSPVMPTDGAGEGESHIADEAPASEPDANGASEEPIALPPVSDGGEEER